jgi:hypothetical protein
MSQHIVRIHKSGCPFRNSEFELFDRVMVLAGVMGIVVIAFLLAHIYR